MEKMDALFQNLINAHTKYIQKKNQRDLVAEYTFSTGRYKQGTPKYFQLLDLINNAPVAKTPIRVLSFQKQSRYSPKVGSPLTTGLLSTTYSPIAMGINAQFSDAYPFVEKYIRKKYTSSELKSLILAMDVKDFADLITLDILETDDIKDRLLDLVSLSVTLPIDTLIKVFDDFKTHATDIDDDALEDLRYHIEENDLSDYDIRDLKMIASRLSVKRLIQLQPAALDLVNRFVAIYNSLKLPSTQACCFFILKVSTGYLFIENFAGPDVKEQREVILAPRTWVVKKSCTFDVNYSTNGFYNWYTRVPPIFTITYTTFVLE